MCIYLGNQEGLTYKKGEHIFPAGLGGIEKLPKGYVSDQANELFSLLELHLMRNSFVSFLRAFNGPGKRGSQKPEDASKTNVVLGKASDGKWQLGYSCMGKPHTILHLWKSKDTYYFCDEEMDKNKIAYFIEQLNCFKEKFVRIISSELSVDDILIGIWKGKYYIGTSNKNITQEEIKGEIAKVIETIQNQNIPDAQIDHVQVKHNIPIEENLKEERVFAKIAINVLAKLKGTKFLENEIFNSVKQFALGENIEDRPLLLPQISINASDTFPDESHWCCFLQKDNKLFAVVCLYNKISHSFEFGEAFDNTGKLPTGFICDWKNKKEYSLMGWIQHIS